MCVDGAENTALFHDCLVWRYHLILLHMLYQAKLFQPPSYHVVSMTTYTWRCVVNMLHPNGKLMLALCDLSTVQGTFWWESAVHAFLHTYLIWGTNLTQWSYSWSGHICQATRNGPWLIADSGSAPQCRIELFQHCTCSWLLVVTVLGSYLVFHSD